MDAFESRGHELYEDIWAESVVSAISREKDGRIYANSDFRKAGGMAGF